MRRRAFVLGAVTALHVGCYRFGGVNPATDEDRAQLVVALDAWKSNRLSELTSRTPPIRLDDEDQVAGLVLVEFTVQAPPLGLHPAEIGVKLSLRDRKGRPIQRHADYRVGMSASEIVVRRSDS